MSASYWPTIATYTCYNDCVQSGCPGHTIKLKEKHGGLIVMFLEADGKTVESEYAMPFDYHLYIALSEIIQKGHY